MDAKRVIVGLCLVIGCTKSETKTEPNAKPITSSTEPAAASGPSMQKPAAELDPSKWNETAPATFRAKFDTSKGTFVVEATRDWSTHGVDRFYNLVKSGYFNDVRFFRAVKGFMAQFGIHGDGAVNALWRTNNIKDDAPKQSNKRGYVSFAKSIVQHSRSTQLFISYGDNSKLDEMGFAPIGKVNEEGMKVVDSLCTDYGDAPPQGNGPDQGRLQAEGNIYLKASFPKLDYVKVARIE